MAAMVNKKINSITEIMHKAAEGEKHLQEGNLFSSIVAFREILDAFLNLKHVQPNDKTKLARSLNDLQRKLASSREFNDLYGKVYFRDNDFATSYDFICQLIKIKEDEIAGVLVNEEANRFLNLNYLSPEDQETTKRMISLVERGELSMLREQVAAHDGLGSLVLSFYNEAGISQRKSGNIDKAIIDYRKALSVSPNDEHLYYNMARAYLEIGQKKNAEASIDQALQINPQFQDGLNLQNFISKGPF